MAREPIVTAGNDLEDPERDLRPQRIADMVGQREVMQRLDIVLDAARKRGEPLGHILFDGPPGLGKTTFATCIPREMNVPLVTSSGPALKAPKDLIPYLTNLEEGAVLFIDEIHRMPKPVEEYLYTAMEDFRLDIVLGEGVNARTINLKLKQFTLIGATTRAGMLSGPLRDRFHIREHLGFYTVEELVEIIRRNSRKLQIPITDDAAVEIARRSRGTPRVANNRLRWVRDYADSKAGGSATLEVARAALLMAGVDVLGLDKQDRGYLETIIRVFGGGPVGVDAVAHTMNLATDTLSDEVEPFLLRSELVVRTPRGRVVTTKAYQHLQIKPAEKPKENDRSLLE
ncbi:Holliday junction branch migration DNA helicase RuvB [Anatilimnocola sp. NA78]|uniref:Holliday junction branch migration DNA helicase RuvB n=1 Tax=Anatilimnocola sp. NA78 TaxID=3415683 RepID=UPI003CE47181